MVIILGLLAGLKDGGFCLNFKRKSRWRWNGALLVFLEDIPAVLIWEERKIVGETTNRWTDGWLGPWTRSLGCCCTAEICGRWAGVLVVGQADFYLTGSRWRRV